MAYTVMAYRSVNRVQLPSYRVMACIVMAYTVMGHGLVNTVQSPSCPVPVPVRCGHAMRAHDACVRARVYAHVRA